jgi:hypothetical protein
MKGMPMDNPGLQLPGNFSLPSAIRATIAIALRVVYDESAGRSCWIYFN